MVWALLTLLFVVGSGDTKELFRSDYVQSIRPRSNTDWGIWAEIDWCCAGDYAYGFQLKVEPENGDNTAVNGIRLFCNRSYDGIPGRTGIHSAVGPWGAWGDSSYCPGTSYLTGVAMKSQPPLGSGDDTSVNNFRFACEQPNSLATSLTDVNAPDRGSFTQQEDCPPKSAICGVKTQVECKQGSGDDTALNGAIFYCCSTDKGLR